MEGRISPRKQGDLGELSALEWLITHGYAIYLPYGHSPDCDLVAENGPKLLRIQVKTSTVRFKNRWVVAVCTKGGNQSWSGLVKRLDPSRIDHLFALVADGRRWFIPADAIGGGTAIHLGGPKYAEFEVDRGHPLPVARARGPVRSPASAGFRSGQTGRTVNPLAQPSQVRILPPP
ncbi:MAG: endonuclease [Solirubrobacteraceae bacterium]|nr:endonuclease [Solirubrobacteraceae bacterium]